MKPEIKVDQMTGETVVVYNGVTLREQNYPIIIYNQGYPWIQRKTNSGTDSGYIIFPEGMKNSIHGHLRNIVIEWKKA